MLFLMVFGDPFQLHLQYPICNSTTSTFCTSGGVQNTSSMLGSNCLGFAIFFVVLWRSNSYCGERPPVAKVLLDELFLGVDPMAIPSQEEVALNIPNGMTHLQAEDVDLVLAATTLPLTFWLELGSFVGGSAIVTVKQILARGWNVSVVTADTFLGDRGIIWEATAEQKQKLLRADGSISLYDRFKRNIQQNAYQSCILPLVATSVVTLRLVASLAERQIIPLPQVIYLDSAHEEDEILLELRLAWKVLPVGGILFGDDWLMPDVETDVLRFAASIEGQLDDRWGREASFLSLGRSLSRVRSGVFVAIESMQWFLKKKPSIQRGAVESDTSTVSSPGYDCWGGGIFTQENCCNEAIFGPGGDARCWDLLFTKERCCKKLSFATGSFDGRKTNL